MNDLKYLGKSETFETTIEIRFALNEFELKYTPDFTSTVYLVPSDEREQRVVMHLEPEKMSEMGIHPFGIVNIIMKNGLLELARLNIPLSELRFSFHTRDYLDVPHDKPVLYRVRLASLYKQNLISREFFNYARTNIEKYCAIPT